MHGHVAKSQMCSVGCLQGGKGCGEGSCGSFVLKYLGLYTEIRDFLCLSPAVPAFVLLPFVFMLQFCVLT